MVPSPRALLLHNPRLIGLASVSPSDVQKCFSLPGAGSVHPPHPEPAAEAPVPLSFEEPGSTSAASLEGWGHRGMTGFGMLSSGDGETAQPGLPLPASLSEARPKSGSSKWEARYLLSPAR